MQYYLLKAVEEAVYLGTYQLQNRDSVNRFCFIVPGLVCGTWMTAALSAQSHKYRLQLLIFHKF